MKISNLFPWRASIAAICMSAALATSVAAQNQKVTMSHASATLLRLPLYVAFENNYFEEEGIDLEVVDTRSGSDAMMMLSGGAVNIATGQLIDAINLKRQGIEVRGVALLTQRITNSIVVRKDLADEITSMADLKGRPFGVTGVGSGTWQFAVYMGVLEGMVAEDFNFIGVGAGANVIGAVTSGRVDAMSYADPENLMLVNSGDAEFLIDMSDDATHRELIGETYLTNQVMTLENFAEENPEAVQNFVNALQRAVNWINENDARTVAELIHGYPGFQQAEFDSLLSSVERTLPAGVGKSVEITHEAFDAAMKFPLAVGAIDEAYDYDELVDNRFAEAAAKAFPPKEQ